MKKRPNWVFGEFLCNLLFQGFPDLVSLPHGFKHSCMANWMKLSLSESESERKRERKRERETPIRSLQGLVTPGMTVSDGLISSLSLFFLPAKFCYHP